MSENKREDKIMVVFGSILVTAGMAILVTLKLGEICK